jgi:uncharacterized protein YjbI with pentapeptide repeats
VARSARGGSSCCFVEEPIVCQKLTRSCTSHHLTLEGATLSDAHLENAYLIGADLEKAALGGAYLHGAKLDLADLTGAGPIGTHLEGVDLSKVLGLTVEQLETARLDRATKLPDGMV